MQKTTLPRKAHRKSRRGCIECKRRHIKCDESHPKCVNCNVSVRHCSYEDLVSEARAFVPKKPKFRPAVERPSPLISSPASSTSSPNSADSPPVNKLHLELFHHFISHIVTSLFLESSLSSGCSLDMTKCILAAPFLMNEILGFAALHLSIVRPLQESFYRHQAAELQTHALTEFNNANMVLTPETCLPMFLFSSILALHMLSEKLLFRMGGFNLFLEDFIQSLRLHRGVRAVTNQSWPLLLKSPLKSLLEAEGNALSSNPDNSGDECATLMELVNSADSLNMTIRNTYRDTIKHLQNAFDGSHQHPARFSAIGPIISWPVIIPPRYVDLLEERTPEALVILAYFGALLHSHREMWMFGDSGAYIVTSIKGYLGPDWETWLNWPSGFVQTGAENA
ncbi:hypothetical protein BDV19DRAFT_370778 [Aspergillus venezuelensis]